MPDVFYSRWDPKVNGIELDCTDEKLLRDLEATMITHALEGERRQFFEHLVVMLMQP